jgi:uncharacterized repeat protein (TIGR03803 family)
MIRSIVLGLGLAAWAVLPSRGASLNTLYNIPGSIDGQTPPAALVSANGALYGTTEFGGQYFSGCIYAVDIATGAVTTVYSFTGGTDGAQPEGALVAVGGALYGTTESGGSADFPAGTVFKFDPQTSKLTTLYSFDLTGGAFPFGALTDVGGELYGTTAYGDGSVFKVDPKTGAEATVYTFQGGNDGAMPFAGLLNIAGMLYGTTSAGGAANDGTVFKLDPGTGAESVVHAFSGSDGQYPASVLITVKGTLFGTTNYGGASGEGTAFKIDIATGTETSFYSFTGGSDGGVPSGGLYYTKGVIYGTTSYSSPVAGGTIFSIDPKTDGLTTLYAFGNAVGGILNGGAPLASLLGVNGLLYGTTSSGGVANGGTLFSFDAGTGAETDLHGFTGQSSGEYTVPGPIAVGDTLYGVAPEGGSQGLGSVFAVNIGSGAATTLHEFAGGTDGFFPTASLLKVGGLLYGTTFGSTNPQVGAGTVFRVNPKTGAEKTLYQFTGNADGGNPRAMLLEHGGLLYGTNTDGGFQNDIGFGALFNVNPKTGAETSDYSFTPPDAPPGGGLIDVHGLLYGTTLGEGNGGNVYSYNPGTGAVANVYTFNGQSDGVEPQDTLLNVGGILYGTTVRGGSGFYGTIFSVNPASGEETILYSFTNLDDGANPEAGLIVDNGSLYGVTSVGGAGDHGTIFKFDLKTATLTPLYAFTGGSDGGSPQGTLVRSKKSFYGTTSAGGSAGRGTLFSFAP